MFKTFWRRSIQQQMVHQNRSGPLKHNYKPYIDFIYTKQINVIEICKQSVLFEV